MGVVGTALGQQPDMLKHRLTGKVWTGKIADTSTMTAISIESVDGAGTTASRDNCAELRWEGVTNAEKYYNDGLRAYNQAQDAFSRRDLDGAKRGYQQALNEFKKIKPQAEQFIRGKFLYSSAAPKAKVCRVMVPKITASSNYNNALKAIQSAVQPKEVGELIGAAASLDAARDQFAEANNQFAALISGGEVKDQREVAGYRRKAELCKRFMSECPQLAGYFRSTAPLFEIDRLKDAENFELDNLIKATEKNSDDWRRVKAIMPDTLKGGHLNNLEDEYLAKQEMCRKILRFRQDFAEADMNIKNDLAAARSAIERKRYGTEKGAAGAFLKEASNELDELNKDFANAGQTRVIEEHERVLGCLKKEASVKSLRNDAFSNAGRGATGDWDRFSEALEQFRQLESDTDANEIGFECASESWVAPIRNEAANQISAITNKMEELDWIYNADEDEWMTPVLLNYQTMLDRETAKDGYSLGTAKKWHDFVSRKIYEGRNDPEFDTGLTTNQITANATYLISQGKAYREDAKAMAKGDAKKAKFDEANEQFALVSEYYPESGLTGEATKEGWLTRVFKNMTALIVAAVVLGLLLLFLFLRRFSTSVIEGKQRKKIEAIEDNRKMKPEKKIAGLDKSIGKLEKLHAKKKLSKNGKAFTKMAYVEKGVQQLKVKQKSGADKSFERANEFQRVEPEEVLPSQAIYFLKEKDTGDEAIAVFSEYLSLPEQYISERLEADIRDLVATAESAPAAPAAVAAVETRVADPDDRFVTTEIALPEDLTPPAGTPKPVTPKGKPTSKKKTITRKKTVIKRKK